MKHMKKLLLIATIALALVNNAMAARVYVSSNIVTSTTWTANNVYDLTTQIYVKPGATLTIEPGTLIQTTANSGGSLAVCRGAKIYSNGTSTKPVIFTSTADTLTSWHAGCNEWGNLTIMGSGLISASHFGGNPVTYQDGAGAPIHTNTKVPDGLNKKQMEGLVAEFPGDPNILYGGNNDNDDSGAITYTSFRYGGLVIGLGNELNGLSLGALGRETDAHHIEIMNNVDDGIEIWGGALNLKYFNIWNIGDDSLDCDEGWRGKAQFGLIVQGYAVNAAQGSGVGDNCFEIDGAEDSDAQPVTTACLYNITAIGQPIAGDQGTAWRDNANVQYRNSIFMDLGERLIKNDNSDGDGGSGYGYNGTLPWATRWTTPASYRSPVNAGTWTPGAFNDPNVLYQAQTSGTLCEMTDCVFFRNLFATAYGDTGTFAGSNTLGVTVAGGSAPLMNNVVAAYNAGDPNQNMPIQKLVRGPVVSTTGGQMLPVIYINPCAANAAVVSVNNAPDDGFFTPAPYRGAFSPYNNWLKGWTAVDAYGMTDTSKNAVASSDLDGNGYVDFSDFSIFSDGWLQVK